MEGPTRKTNAGPIPLALSQGQRKSFLVTGTYVRGQDKGIEGMLKTATITDDLKIEGPLSIVSSIETTKDLLCCKYSEEFDVLAAGFTDGTVRIFKSNTAECLGTLCDMETQEGSSPVTSIEHRVVSKNYPITNCITCTYTNGCVKCWNHNFGQCIYTIREKRQTFGLTYHPRLPKFITYGDNLKIYLYDEETRTQERILCSRFPEDTENT